MEHKLITGGEQWLPFARSRIKALRATGLAHASQKFEIEGALIDVRIEPGHEYIRIEGGGSTAYLETGQLSWNFYGLNDARWAEAAKWKFMDIQTTSKYLGNITAAGEALGTQKNDPVLIEGQSSLAIGYPLAKSGSAPERETKDAQTQAKYRESTLAKKKMMDAYPASIFSGKMRLYMQALYGAKEPEKVDDLPFVVDDSTGITVAMFHDPKGGGGVIAVRPESMGIFTAPDNTYWLLDINEGPGKVLVFKINTDRVSGLVKALPTNTADREKIEAYIFANSRLEIPKVDKQIWAKGSFGMASGSSLAYGWKWNTGGSEASIVVHEELGDDVISEIRWHARTVHLSLSYSTSEGVSVSGSIVDHNDWIDGWGAYNIFVPPSNTAYAPLNLKSLRAGAGLIPPDIAFPFTPIYGWYVNDTWTPVEISSELTSSFEAHAESTGVVYPYGGSCPQYPANPFTAGAVDGDAGYSVLSEQTTINGGRRFRFGAHSYDGRSRVLNTSRVEWSTTGGPDENLPNQVSEWVEQWSGDAGGGYPASTAFDQIYASRPQYPPYIMYFRYGWKQHTRVVLEKTGAESRKFVVIIPGGDAEAIYLATNQDRESGDVVTTTSGYWVSGKMIFWIDTPNVIDLGYYPGWHGLPWTVDIAVGSRDSWSPDGVTTVYGPSTTETTDVLDREIETRVFCFNRKLHGVEGVPGGSYEGLFSCAYTHPQYDRGMYTFTSNGKRWIMSDGPSPGKSPSSVEWNRFVGWA